MDEATLKAIAQQVVDRLKAAGFKVQRYDALTTNSIYLKLDYGMCNSIRISDHKGRKYQQYRYNLLSQHSGVLRNRSRKGLEHCYYGFDNVDILIDDILKARDNKLLKYGYNLYGRLMQQSYDKHRFEVGSWAQGIEV
jgi:hypothetical protein